MQKHDASGGSSSTDVRAHDRPAAGKGSRTDHIQRKAAGTAAPEASTRPPVPAAAPAPADRALEDPFGLHLAPVQRAGAGGAIDDGDVHAAAATGTSGSAGPLPHLSTIQLAFGHHDVSGVEAHTGEAASRGARAMGAEAFASGNHVAFDGAPSLHTAAHEAAHVVQQRAGVHLKGGVGEAGDSYEQHADAVADRVVAGGSAVELLDQVAPRGGAPRASGPVQMVGGLKEGAKVLCGKLPLPQQGYYFITAVSGKATYTLCEKEDGSGKTHVMRQFDVIVYNEPKKQEVVEELDPSKYKVDEEVRSPLHDLDSKLKVKAAKQRVYTLTNTKTNLDVEGVPEWQVLGGDKPKEDDKKDEAEHKLTTDELLDSKGVNQIDKVALNSPTSVKGGIGVHSGKTYTAGGSSFEEFKETARIDVSSVCDEGGVTIKFEIRSNPKYMCLREYPKGHQKEGKDIKDLVPVYLESKNDVFPDLITVVEPTNTENVFDGQVRYTWDCLLKLLRLPKEIGKKAQQTVISNFTAVGVKAQWFANTKDGTNNQNHTSGGVNQKGGSGLVPFKEITLNELEETEAEQRNTEWNMGERMHEGRSVFKDHKAIMELGKELATTLEAESEYMVDGGAHAAVIAKMNALQATKELWARFGIEKMERKDPKEYVDTYYDIVGTKDNDLTLLKKSVVLRERRVKGDPKNTFLMAIKGRSHEQLKNDKETGERMRLAAQVNLDRGKMVEGVDPEKSNTLSQTGQEGLDSFVTDTSVDNPFARTLDHALNGDQEDQGGTSMKDLMGDDGHVQPVLQIKSTRNKFLMQLAGGTAIDFSADCATGFKVDSKTGTPVDSNAPPKVYSFEFGVGHPGLAATGTGTSGGGGVSRLAQMFGEQINNKKAEVTRPYHVAKDLTNDELFDKSDYKQFQKLRDEIINDILGMKKGSLKQGGNKAHLLAKELGMIPKEQQQKQENEVQQVGGGGNQVVGNQVGGNQVGGNQVGGNQVVVDQPKNVPDVVSKDNTVKVDEHK